MSLLDALGLGGIFGNGYPLPTYNQQLGNYLPQYLTSASPTYFCPHGAVCPICLENTKRLVEANMKKEEEIAKKKEDYKKRCEEYMIRFRQ